MEELINILKLTLLQMHFQPWESSFQTLFDTNVNGEKVDRGREKTFFTETTVGEVAFSNTEDASVFTLTNPRTNQSIQVSNRISSHQELRGLILRNLIEHARASNPNAFIAQVIEESGRTIENSNLITYFKRGNTNSITTTQHMDFFIAEADKRLRTRIDEMQLNIEHAENLKAGDPLVDEVWKDIDLESIFKDTRYHFITTIGTQIAPLFAGHPVLLEQINTYIEQEIIAKATDDDFKYHQAYSKFWAYVNKLVADNEHQKELAQALKKLQISSTFEIILVDLGFELSFKDNLSEGQFEQFKQKFIDQINILEYVFHPGNLREQPTIYKEAFVERHKDTILKGMAALILLTASILLLTGALAPLSLAAAGTIGLILNWAAIIISAALTLWESYILVKDEMGYQLEGDEYEAYREQALAYNKQQDQHRPIMETLIEQTKSQAAMAKTEEDPELGGLIEILYEGDRAAREGLEIELPASNQYAPDQPSSPR